MFISFLINGDQKKLSCTKRSHLYFKFLIISESPLITVFFLGKSKKLMLFVCSDTRSQYESKVSQSFLSSLLSAR
jgi:hypothetical protein